MKRVLIIGSWGTTHIRRYLRILCQNKDKNLIVDSFDTRYEEGQGNECGVENVYRVKLIPVEKKILKIRKIGTYWGERKKLSFFEQIIRNGVYDLVNIHFLPSNVDYYVRIAHKYGVKTMLTPLGSDVLRVNKIHVPSLKRAFNNTDYVSLNTITGFCQKVKDAFNVDEGKIVNLGYGSETISAMLEMKGKYNRQQYIDMLSLPKSSYYICCGYTASRAQNHLVMLDAIAKNTQFLPSDYCALIPLSYGPAKEQLKSELSEKCKELGIRYHILSDYMTIEQVAALRFVSDLMIHIQPTDAYNASLQEFLLGGTDVINGSWLEYPSLERFGKPYYTCDTIDSLTETLYHVINGELNKTPLLPDVVVEITGNAWSEKIKKWISFFTK